MCNQKRLHGLKKRGARRRAAAGFLAAVCLCTTGAFPLPAHAAGPSVSAQAAVLMNASDGTLLWEKNGEEKLPMASTTKIMTALLTLETASLDDRAVDITDAMVRVEGSSMGLHAGDRVTLSALAKGMLSVSGNDAANAAAYALDGSPQAFAAHMNRRAEELGLRNTHFVTPSGLDDDAHYTTASDLAKLARAAMQNPAFAAITAQRTIKIPYLSPDVSYTFTNHNKLLAQYQGCIGVKTGFTKKAGRCLVSCAERDGVRLIAVTLHAPDDWNDHKAMLDYGFGRLHGVQLDDSSFVQELPVVGAAQNTVSVQGGKGPSVVLPVDTVLQREVELPRFLYAPLEEGSVVGRVVYRAGGAVVGETALVASAVARQPVPEKNLWEKIADFFQRK